MSMSVFDRLAASCVIAVDDKLLPGVGACDVGAVASVAPDVETGQRFIDTHRVDIESLGVGSPRLLPVGDPWKLMRRAAGEGLAGIAGIRTENPLGQFMFMVRVEEAGASLPTVLTSITEDGWGPSLTRVGEAKIHHGDVVHWQRFDLLDHVNGQWGQRCPFRGWDHGDVLYELRSDSLVVVLANVPLIGDWNSTDGAFAFFTDETAAQDYLENRLGDGRNRMIVEREGPEDPHEAMASLRPQPVHDLKARLVELMEISPLSAWCVNPAGHREIAGYGRLDYGGYHPASIEQTPSGPLPRMIAVSGHWSIQPGNVFKLEKPLAPWTGVDTVRWSWGQALQLTPLDRSFAHNVMPDSFCLDDLTDSDAEAMVTQELARGDDMETAWEELYSRSAVPTGRLEQFHIVAWDAVTGDGADFPWRFPDVLEALKFLTMFERLHDRTCRNSGAVSCTSIGFAGSDDEEFENLRSQRFELAMHRIALRIIRRTYAPKDADDLVAICNSTLRTLHVDIAGYPKDLIWASPSEQVETVCEQLEIDATEWEIWRQSAEAVVDADGSRLALARLGPQAWEALLPRSRHFLATALCQMEHQGRAPQLDYAPISLEVVKALEVELVRVFEGFRDHLHGNTLAYDRANDGHKSLIEYLRGGKPPTIGAMSYLLQKPKSDDAELAHALHAYVMSRENGEFLTNRDFVKQGLNRVVHKYRNGGVHDSPISWETCKECIENVVGSPEEPGYLSKLVLCQG